MRLFRINLEVSDLRQASAFYADLFGLDGRPQRGGRFYLDVGGVTLQIVEVAEPHLAAKSLYFAVPDLEAVYARAKALNCLSQEAVHGAPGGDMLLRPWGERSFYAQDPCGNPLCFVDENTLFRC